MSQQVEGNKSYTAGAARAAFLRVYSSGGSLVTAGATVPGEGVQQSPSYTTTEVVGVKRFGADGTFKMVAAGAITADAELFAAADGKVAATGTIRLQMKALEAATTNGDVFEAVPILATSAAQAVAANGSTQGTAAALTGVLNVVSGADGTKGVILGTPAAGVTIQVYNSTATNGLKIYPHSGGDINDGSADAAITIEGKTLATLVGLDATTWAAQFTANT